MWKPIWKPIWKPVALTLPGLLLILSGCNKVESTNSLNEESCDLCHHESLTDAVHQKHMSMLAMSNFPGRSEAVGALLKAESDTSYHLALDSGDTVDAKRQARLLARNIQCGECHQGVSHAGMKIDNGAHNNGRVDVNFDNVWLNEKYKTSAKTTFKGNSCDNIACHGGGREGLLFVKWNAAAKESDTLSCNSCHNVVNHKPGVRCDLCHFDVTHDGKTISNPLKHMDGVLDVEE